jgi:hypothetical protein
MRRFQKGTIVIRMRQRTSESEHFLEGGGVYQYYKDGMWACVFI